MGSVPQPFPIPKFRPSTEENLQNKILKDTDRKYIVQTLATLLMTHMQRPSLRDCGLVAKALVGKCEFLKDDEGDGEVSEQYSLLMQQKARGNVFCKQYKIVHGTRLCLSILIIIL